MLLCKKRFPKSSNATIAPIRLPNHTLESKASNVKKNMKKIEGKKSLKILFKLNDFNFIRTTALMF